MPNQSGKAVLVLVLFILILGAAVYFFLPHFRGDNIKPSQNPYSMIPKYSNNESKTSSGFKDYYSDDLKLYLSIPREFNMEEKPSILKLSSEKGSIEITRNITEYESLEEYLDFFDSKRNIKILERKVFS